MSKSPGKKIALPMVGGLVSDAAAILRLGERVRTETSGVSPGDARRALSDQPDVSDETLERLLRSLVALTFTAEYLTTRGLTRSEQEKHQALLGQAVMDLARDFAKIARFANQAPRLPARFADFMFVYFGYTRELALRAAAYATLFGRLHPALERIEAWWNDRGLRRWFRDVELRAGVNRLKIERVAKLAKPPIARNTLKGLRDGRELPQSKTIDTLASALAQLGLTEPLHRGPVTAAEIAFEMRLACVVAEARRRIGGERAFLLHQVLRELTYLRSRLRMVERIHVEDLLVRGTASPSWREIEPEMRELALQDLAQFVATSLTLSTAIDVELDEAALPGPPDAPDWAETSAPESCAPKTQLALRLAGEGHYEEALSILNERREAGSPSVVERAARGFCLVRLGRVDEGEEILTHVLQEHRHHPFALRGLAACHRARGDVEAARDAERKADFYEGRPTRRSSRERGRGPH